MDDDENTGLETMNAVKFWLLSIVAFAIVPLKRLHVTFVKMVMFAGIEYLDPLIVRFANFERVVMFAIVQFWEIELLNMRGWHTVAFAKVPLKAVD